MEVLVVVEGCKVDQLRHGNLCDKHELMNIALSIVGPSTK